WLFAGQVIVEPVPSVHAPPDDLSRNCEKLSVVPDESERRAIVIAVSGSDTPEFCPAMAGSFHFVILPWKMFASVGPSSWSLSTPDRLYATAIGLMTTGKYRTLPPLNVGRSSGLIGESEPA